MKPKRKLSLYLHDGSKTDDAVAAAAVSFTHCMLEAYTR